MNFKGVFVHPILQGKNAILAQPESRRYRQLADPCLSWSGKNAVPWSDSRVVNTAVGDVGIPAVVISGKNRENPVLCLG